MPVSLLFTPLPQVSETAGIQSKLVVPLVVPVALLSTPLPQVSEPGGGTRATLIVPVALLSTPLPQVSETGGGTGGYVNRTLKKYSSIIVYATAASIRDRCRRKRRYHLHYW